MLGVAFDPSDQIRDAFEGTGPDGLLCDQAEPAFHLIEPRGIGGRVVDMIAGASRQPAAHIGMFMHGVVVADDMDVEVFRHLLVNVFEEGEELLVSMASLAFGKHLTTRDIERGKQPGRAMAYLIVGNPLHIAQPHR